MSDAQPSDDKEKRACAVASASGSTWRPATGPPPSSAALSTREPSRELPPSRAGPWSGLDDEGDGGEHSRRAKAADRPASGQRSSSMSRERGVVVAMVDEEIARLQPAHEVQIVKVAELKQQLKAARAEEQREAHEQSKRKAEKLHRSKKVTSHMQACVRGWLVRKRIVEAMDKRKVQMQTKAAKLPDMLRDQLMQLQHGVHDLKYRPQEQDVAAVKLQAWWRSIAARRVVKLVQIARMLQVIGLQMSSAARTIQAWFRMIATRARLCDEIRFRMEATKQKQLRDMETALCAIIQIQRGYRGKLAKQKLVELEERNLKMEATLGRQIFSSASMVLNQDQPALELVDTWKPATMPGAVPAGSGIAGVIITTPPREDREVDKINAIGLVPFYGACSERVIRHQIGGPTALMMQEQLAISGELCRASGDKALDNIPLSNDVLGDVWDIYPNGLTEAFLPSLDPDVWERGGRSKSYRNSLRLRGVRRKSNRRSKADCQPRPCTTIVARGPSNAEARAQLREVQQNVSIAANNEDTGDVEDHPLFINAPPKPPSRAAPAARSARFFQAVEDDDELGAWGQISVEKPPKYRSQRQPRGIEDYANWDPLNVPVQSDADAKKWRPGEISHERVWSIAQSLAEKLPALTAG